MDAPKIEIDKKNLNISFAFSSSKTNYNLKITDKLKTCIEADFQSKITVDISKFKAGIYLIFLELGSKIRVSSFKI